VPSRCLGSARGTVSDVANFNDELGSAETEDTEDFGDKLSDGIGDSKMIRHLLKSDTLISIAALLAVTCFFFLGRCPVVLAGGVPINPCVPPQQFLGGPPVPGNQIPHNGHYQGYCQPGTPPCVCQKIKKPIGHPAFLPIRVMDPGPVRPVVTNTVGLAGALLAAPFRLIETVIPPALPQQDTVPGRGCRPQPPFRTPACGNDIPPAVVAENRHPILEPQGLLVGVIKFPFTLFGQGRFAGDLGEGNQ
jgi:hypothetical protein